MPGYVWSSCRRGAGNGAVKVGGVSLVVSWPQGANKPKTQQLHNLAGFGALSGTFWGMLFGLIFFVPLFGAALGAAAGALGGMSRTLGKRVGRWTDGRTVGRSFAAMACSVNVTAETVEE
ncbi:DUF1269 domain-containing protein [Streptomyces sp. MBT62]|nr:DUF1269 domain-containing protein [Streptomyces sp. MBT62]